MAMIERQNKSLIRRKHDAKFFCEYRVEPIASLPWAAVFCHRLIERVTTIPAMVEHFICTL
jgi:hypothetical protein